MTDPAQAGGLVALGILFGILFVRWSETAAKKAWLGQGPCAACGKDGYLVHCRRCGKKVAMCHYYGVLYPDRPIGFRKRRAVEVCTDCVRSEEASVLSGLGDRK